MIARYLRHPTHPFYPLAFATLLISWGIWLVLPGSSYVTTHGFDWIRHWVSEDQMGSLAIAIGVAQATMVMMKIPRLVLWSTLLSFYFWLFMTISYAQSDWQLPGVIVYGWLCIMSGLGYVNFKLNMQQDSPVD